MVRLDGGRRPLHRYRLNDIGIQRSLYEVLDAAVGFAVLQLEGFFGEDRNELVSDNFALFLWISDAFELVQEAIRGIHADDMQSQTIAEHFEGVLELVLAKHASVHKDVDQPVADGAMDQDCGYGGIHAATQRTDGLAWADFLADGLGGFLDESGATPFGLGFADAE